MMDGKSLFGVAMEVSSTWEQVKRIPNYEELIGQKVLQRFLVSDCYSEEFLEKVLSPSIKAMTRKQREGSSYPEEQQQGEFDLSILFKNPFIRAQMSKYVRVLSMTVDLLGPDTEVIEDQMMGLGATHIKHGVTPNYYRAMGKAVIQTVEELLGDQNFPERTKESWEKFVEYLSSLMIRGASNELFDGAFHDW